MAEMATPKGEPTVAPELQECLDALRGILKEHIRIADGLIQVLLHVDAAEEAEPDVKRLLDLRAPLSLLVQAAGASSESLLLVTAKIRPGARDGYVIARGIVETIINACYFLAAGRDAVERARVHAEQMMHDDLHRESRIARTVITTNYGNSDPGPREAVLTPRKTSRRSWTKLNVDQRISHAGAVLGEAVERDLHFARFMVYRHGSEIIHGTLFGAMFWLGMTTPRPLDSADALAKHIGEHEMLVLLAALIAWAGLFESLRHHGLGSPASVSDSLFRALGGLRYFATPAK